MSDNYYLPILDEIFTPWGYCVHVDCIFYYSVAYTFPHRRCLQSTVACSATPSHPKIARSPLSINLNFISFSLDLGNSSCQQKIPGKLVVKAARKEVLIRVSKARF